MKNSIIDPLEFGVSFSLKQCRSFGIDPKETLKWLIEDMGFRRFRLMSYWNEHEKEPDNYNFSELDWQVRMIAEAGGQVSLCLGARQPRWPENHWPKWAWEAPERERERALLRYISETVNRHKDNTCIVSYQLENEALLKNFGERPEVDRKRLREEFRLVKRLDVHKPIVMTTSTSWGIPIRRPIPDIVGFSYYHTLYQNGKYKYSLFYPWVHTLRRMLIQGLHWKPVFIHELQLEPWGPTAIWKMPVEEQDKSMSTAQIAKNIRLARKIKADPIDLWGGEWWYWRLKRHDDRAIAEAVAKAIS